LELFAKFVCVNYVRESFACAAASADEHFPRQDHTKAAAAATSAKYNHNKQQQQHEKVKFNVKTLRFVCSAERSACYNIMT